MNGFIKKSVAGLAISAGLSSLGGCVLYRQVVDPCYPERYTSMARMSVKDTFNAQAQRGHTLDQTIWGHHFEKDGKTGDDVLVKDAKTKEERVTLTAGAKEHLKYIAFRQPTPDPVVMLQRDVNNEVNFRRKLAIENYLATLMPGRPFVVEEWDVRELNPVVLPPRFQDQQGNPNPGSSQLILPQMISGSTTSGGGSGGSQ